MDDNKSNIPIGNFSDPIAITFPSRNWSVIHGTLSTDISKVLKKLEKGMRVKTKKGYGKIIFFKPWQEDVLIRYTTYETDEQSLEDGVIEEWTSVLDIQKIYVRIRKHNIII